MIFLLTTEKLISKYILCIYMRREEQLIRMVKLFGNGAHVFVPKEWAGEQVVLVKPEKKNVKELIFSALGSYLESIIGVYLYGSYARAEEKQNSDIDIFVISDKRLKIKVRGFEIHCLEQKEIEKAIRLEPVLMYSFLSEAKPLINSQLLEELKVRYKPHLRYFMEFLRDCRRIIRVQEDFLRSETGMYVLGAAVVYSLVLRLRGIFIIRSLLDGIPYTHVQFKVWIERELPEIDFDSMYESYRSSKNEEKIKQKIKVCDVQRLLEFLRQEVSFLEHGQKRKKA